MNALLSILSTQPEKGIRLSSIAKKLSITKKAAHQLLLQGLRDETVAAELHCSKQCPAELVLPKGCYIVYRIAA